MVRKSLSDIEHGVSYFMVLMTGIMDVARQKNIPFEAVYRLSKPSNRKTLERMIEIAHEDWQQEQRQRTLTSAFSTGQQTDTVRILRAVYQQPSYQDLRQMFDWVHDGFRYREFKPIEACRGIPLHTRDLAFELFHLDRQLSTETVFEELAQRGYRPALYEELISFVKAFPDEQKQYPIVALGSVCRKGQEYGCSCVLWHEGKRKIDFGWLAGDWHDGCRFLAVKLY